MPHKQKQNELPQAPTIVNTKLDRQVKLIADVRKRLKKFNQQVEMLCDDLDTQRHLLVDTHEKVRKLMAIVNKTKLSKHEFVVLDGVLRALDNLAGEIQDEFVQMKKDRSAIDGDFSQLAGELKPVRSALKRIHCKSPEESDLLEEACDNYNVAIDRLAAQRSALFKVSQNFNETDDKSFAVQVGDCVNRIKIAKEMISEMEPVKAAGKKYGLAQSSFLRAPAKDVPAEAVNEQHADKKRCCTIL